MNEIESLYALYERCGRTVTTDSRRCPSGSLFFALRGDTFDGNAYAAAALQSGCAAAVVDNPAYAPAGDGRYLLVDDCLKALQRLAAHHRRQWGKTVLQVTGTNGKTTTKELTAAVLSQRYHVLYTEGNLNNHIGVPLTLLRLRPEHDMALIETGANHPGEIDFLSRLAQPDYGLITNVGKAHLEGFGSYEGVLQTKTELYRYLADHGGRGIFVNAASADLLAALPALPAVRYGIGVGDGLSVMGEPLACNPLLTFRWRVADGTWQTVESHLAGAYNLANFLAAAAVGVHFGVSPDDVTRALAAYTPGNNRSQLVDTGKNHLIVDAYNANPTSMMAALESFDALEADNKMVILGDMRELGADSEAEHRRVAAYVQARFARAWLVGPQFAALQPEGCRCFARVDDVMEALREQPLEGLFILIKGSHGTQLYRLPACL